MQCTLYQRMIAVYCSRLSRRTWVSEHIPMWCWIWWWLITGSTSVAWWLHQDILHSALSWQHQGHQLVIIQARNSCMQILMIHHMTVWLSRFEWPLLHVGVHVCFLKRCCLVSGLRISRMSGVLFLSLIICLLCVEELQVYLSFKSSLQLLIHAGSYKCCSWQQAVSHGFVWRLSYTTIANVLTSCRLISVCPYLVHWRHCPWLSCMYADYYTAAILTISALLYLGILQQPKWWVQGTTPTNHIQPFIAGGWVLLKW